MEVAAGSVSAIVAVGRRNAARSADPGVERLGHSASASRCPGRRSRRIFRLSRFRCYHSVSRASRSRPAVNVEDTPSSHGESRGLRTVAPSGADPTGRERGDGVEEPGATSAGCPGGRRWSLRRPYREAACQGSERPAETPVIGRQTKKARPARQAAIHPDRDEHIASGGDDDARAPDASPGRWPRQAAQTTWIVHPAARSAGARVGAVSSPAQKDLLCPSAREAGRGTIRQSVTSKGAGRASRLPAASAPGVSGASRAATGRDRALERAAQASPRSPGDGAPSGACGFLGDRILIAREQALDRTGARRRGGARPASSLRRRGRARNSSAAARPAGRRHR